MKVRITTTTEYGKIDKVVKINDENLVAELQKLFECSQQNMFYVNETVVQFETGQTFKLIIAPQKSHQVLGPLKKLNFLNVIKNMFRRKSI